MNWLVVALGAQFLIGLTSVFDKLLLKRKFFDPWVYTFWFGVTGLFPLIFLPYGIARVSLAVAALALVGGVVFMASAFFLYSALFKSEASETLPLAGALSPLFTLLVGFFVLRDSLDLGQMLGFVALLLAAFIIAFEERADRRARVVLFVVAGALCLGIYHVIAKLIFLQAPFLMGFILLKLGDAIAVFTLLIVPRLRRRVLRESGASEVSNRIYFFANRGLAGVGSIFFNYAIALSHPALVDATTSFRYIVILLGGWLLLHERFRGRLLLLKLSATGFVMVGLLLFGSVEYARSIPVDPLRPIRWGVTFSDKFSRHLGIDWKSNFLGIRDDLRPRAMRLIAYWDEIEAERGQYDFSNLDWQLDELKGRTTEVILAVGMKTPRWPECHIPAWAEELPTEERELALRRYLGHVIERYQDRREIKVWQVENEPYLPFGECPTRGSEFLEKEITLVRSFDTSRPILATDGGEFGLWYKAVSAGDMFGTTMYRRVYPKVIGPIFGTVDYHIDPAFFRLKEKVVRWYAKTPDKKFIVIELQAEPWGRAEIPQLSHEEQIQIFSPEYFRETIEYAKQTGFSEYYLWGAEWWYYLKEKKGDARIWEEAKNLFFTNHNETL